MASKGTNLTVLGIFSALVALVHAWYSYRFIHVGILVATHPLDSEGDAVVADTIGLLWSFVEQLLVAGYWVVLVGFLAAGTFGAVMTILQLVTAYGLIARKLHGLCMTVSKINWFMFPLGTPLGIVGFVILRRAETKELFGIPSGGTA